MISIAHHDRQVIVTVRGQWPVAETNFIATCELGNDVYATLVADNLRRHLCSTLIVIREKAYEQGWKDAKAHNRKADWFSGRFDA
jgi:hypothetical protein